MPTEMAAEGQGVAPVPPAPPALAQAFSPPAFSPPAFSPPAFTPPPFSPPASPPAFSPPAFSPPAFSPPAFSPPGAAPPASAQIVAPLRPATVPPPPPLGARPSGTRHAAVARPADATAMVHHHVDAIAAGLAVSVGADDTFYGVVVESGERQVAFALMTGVRHTPEPCEGYFVSRGVEGVELTHGGLALHDRNGNVGEVSVEGRMSFEIVDPVKLLTSDCPLDDDALGSLVTGSMADAVDRALREGLARGEYTMHELISGDADVRVLDRCTSERIGPKLVRSHGVSTEVAELRIRGTLASETDSAKVSDPSDGAHGAPEHSDEETMEEPTFVERPNDSSALIYRAPGSLPAGTIVGVRMDDNFLGLIGGEPPQQLPPGRHRVARALDAGVFVAMTGETTSFGAELGALKDFHGASADVRIVGKVEVHVDDPLELGAALGHALTADSVLGRVRNATADVVRVVLREGLAGGEWDLGGLGDPAEIEELIRRAAKAYDTLEGRVPGTTIEVLDLSVTTGEIARIEHAHSTIREPEPRPIHESAPEPMQAPMPQPAHDSVPPEMGTMHVRPDEIHELEMDDAERTMLPIASMQYPPREASRPRDVPSEPPDSVMPTAVSPPGYVQEVMQQLTPLEGIPQAVHEDGEPRLTLPSARPPPQAIEPKPPPVVAPAEPPALAANDPWRDFAPAPEQPTHGGPPVLPQAHAHGFAIGAQVLVMWSDGQRYPGQVHQTTPDHCLVLFTNGHQQWVPTDALTGA